jgi:SAM-dependent methyltransferase
MLDDITGSATYWQTRYRAGGTSGAGSAGRLLGWKAAVINGFIAANGVGDVLDLGCGDGALAARIAVARYRGTDVAADALARTAAARDGSGDTRLIPWDAMDREPPAELALSFDVIFHLVEDRPYGLYMRRLLAASRRFILVYASNVDRAWPARHVRHRRFTDAIPGIDPTWRVAAHVPNPYPYDHNRADTTSFADLYLLTRPGESATLVIPAG